YGQADLESDVPATPLTNYRLASLTKQFTAAAIALLVEARRLRFDDLAGRWLPELPESAGAIRLRHLLTHTSGLIDYEDLIPAGTEVALRDADVIGLLAAEPRLYFAPGTGFRYSNGAYALLALIVERAAGIDFASFLRERIFAPLGMSASVAHEQGRSMPAHRAYGYSALDGRWRRTDQSLTSAVLGDGGIYSSIDDLARWDAALDDDRLLSASSRQQLFAAQIDSDDPNVRYGMGFRISGEMLWHSGESIGFRNVILRFPRRRLSVIVLTNRDDPEPYALALKIAGLCAPDSYRW
ncbi:MAG: beta-lactamase family protein, partial [Gammaproteobacteria bacterium]|nr:beta-lactamase family protein [Gammaproteobacteria bacterium]